MNNNTWYNIRQENGSTIIEQKEKTTQNDSNTSSTFMNNYYALQPKNPKKHNGKILIGLVILLVAIAITSFFFFGMNKNYRNGPFKKRTFMIYMVGSDLESSGSMATFDLNDIKDANIDLENNNVILMVGGSKKWHNFVDPNEIGIYELTSDGFNKKKSMSVSSMGTESSLLTLLDYSYDNYPSDKYDMIFWNHGLGAVGLEQDELKEDFLDITELSSAFSKSPFSKEKLEVVIFNNCLSGNIHFADIMSKYADYMVGSEEVMYVGMIIDRLNFIENVKSSDGGYQVAKTYVDQTVKSMSKINSLGRGKYDSTMSIIDLSNIDNLNNKINKFFKSIDLNSNYYSIARARSRAYTYAGDLNYVYDTVDLYELVDALAPYSSDTSLARNLKQEINNTVKYNQALNSHSNGLSIYFPYYGNTNYIEGHLYYFGNLWKNDYTNFISEFYNSNNSTRRARRAVTGEEINKLTNKIETNGNKITLKLTEDEEDIYQRANVYIFSKTGNKYNLLLKTNNVTLNDNVLSYNHYGVLKTKQNYYISLFNNGNYKVYESYNDSDLITNINIENGKVSFLDSIIDSGDNPSGGIFTKEEDSEKTSLYTYSYDLVNNDGINGEWIDTLEKEKIEIENTDNLVIDENLNGLYILIEMYDINNDIFYSEVQAIK